MSLEKQDSRPTPELLAELTGRPVSEFELPDDVEIPEIADLEKRDADEFYSE